MKSPVLLRWLGITFVVFAITLWVGKYITENVLSKTYEATAKVQVNVNRIPDMSLTTSGSEEGNWRALYQPEFEIMQSPDILLPLIRDLGLDKAWAKRISKSGGEKLSEGDALAYLSKILKIDGKWGTNIIDIIVASDDPKEAADIANALADGYKTRRDRDEDQRITRGMASLREIIAEQEKVVVEAKVDSQSLDAERRLQEQQSLLEALRIKLQQKESDSQHMQSPVRILTRATAPEYPSKPDKAFCYMVRVGVAALVSVVVGCFVEVIMLFCRAGRRRRRSGKQTEFLTE